MLVYYAAADQAERCSVSVHGPSSYVINAADLTTDVTAGNLFKYACSI